MTSKPTTDDRARIFLQYGFQASENSPQLCAEMEGWEEEAKYARHEFIHDLYADQIMKAVQWYTDDLVFAYNSPKAKVGPYSELEQEIFYSLTELPEETLRILAAVMTAKTGAN